MVSPVGRYIIPQARSTNPTHSRSTSSSSSSSSSQPSQTSLRERSSSSSHQSINWRAHRSENSLSAISATSDAEPGRQISPPSDQRRAFESQWREAAGKKPANDWVVGRVVLLPFEDQVPDTSIARQKACGDPWYHPAVITEKWEVNGEKFVTIRTCTSFGGQGIEHRHGHLRHHYIEVDASQLAEGSDEFPRQTFVNCSPRIGSSFSIEYDMLVTCTGKSRDTIQFSDAAMNEIARKLRQYDNS